MRELINRLSEPSTYAGLGGLALVLEIGTETFNGYVAAVAGVFAFFAIIVKEGKGASTSDTTSLRSPRLAAAAAVLLTGLMAAGCAGQLAGTQAGKQQLEVDQSDEQTITGPAASISPLNWDPTLYAGILAARIVMPQEDGLVVVAELLDGKERGGASVSLPFGPDGPVLSFNSTDSRAFTGQQVRAAVEQALFAETGKTIREATPELRGLVETAIKGLCSAVGVVGCAAAALSDPRE